MAKKTSTAAVAVQTVSKKSKSYTPPPALPPVVKGQIVYVTVLPFQLFGDYFDRSPKLFATREAAQADCNSLNKTRNPSSHFVVREMEVN